MPLNFDPGFLKASPIFPFFKMVIFYSYPFLEVSFYPG